MVPRGPVMCNFSTFCSRKLHITGKPPGKLHITGRTHGPGLEKLHITGNPVAPAMSLRANMQQAPQGPNNGVSPVQSGPGDFFHITGNTMTYKGYRITKTRSGGNYVVTTPSGTRFGEIATNLKTAKKWVDAERIANAERHTR